MTSLHNIQLVTLPHTGTHFMADLLGVNSVHIMHLPRPGSKRGPEVQFVVPYRHPFSVWESWVKRGTVVSRDLAETQDLLNDLIDEYEDQVLIIPIDLPTVREDQLRKLGRYETDWLPDRVHAPAKNLPAREHIEVLGRYIEVLHPRIGEFYGY